MRKQGSRLIVAAVLVIAGAVPGRGSAQVAANPNYFIKGSDTLFDIMTASINAAKAPRPAPRSSTTARARATPRTR
jgi:hypothetical protein